MLNRTISGGGGDGGRGGGLLVAVKKLLHNPSFFRRRRENLIFIDSPRKSSSSSNSIQRQALSPTNHSLSSSDDCLPRISCDELGFDIESMSLEISNDELADSMSHFSGNELGFKISDDELTDSVSHFSDNERELNSEMMSLQSSEVGVGSSGHISLSSVCVSSVLDLSHQGCTSVTPNSTTSLGSLSLIQRESPSLPHLSSAESLPGFAHYVLSFDVERDSLRSREEWITSSSSNFSMALYQSHRWTISTSNSSFSCAAIGNENRIYDFVSSTGLLSHLSWHRAYERLAPSTVSSSDTEPTLENHIKNLLGDLQDSSTELGLNTNCGAISVLINLLSSIDMKIQERAALALLYLSINDNSKCAMAVAGAIEPLIHVLSTGTPEAQEASAATLFSLSHIEANKVNIERAINVKVKGLVDLLENGTPSGKKDALTALYNLSLHDELKSHILKAGAVKSLIESMCPSVGMADEAVFVLSNLSFVFEGRTEIFLEGGVPILVETLKFGSLRAKEEVTVILLLLCTDDRFCNSDFQLESVAPLVTLSLTGTSRGQKMARKVLSYLLLEYCMRKGDDGVKRKGVDFFRDMDIASIDVQRHATAELLSLAEQNTDNRAAIGHSGAIITLVRLLRSRDAIVQKNAFNTLLLLSMLDEDKARMVRAGAVPYLVRLVFAANSNDAIAVLSNLATIPEGRQEIIVQQWAIPILIKQLQEIRRMKLQLSNLLGSFRSRIKAVHRNLLR